MHNHLHHVPTSQFSQSFARHLYTVRVTTLGPSFGRREALVAGLGSGVALGSRPNEALARIAGSFTPLAYP